MALLEVRNLRMYYRKEKDFIKAVDDVSFSVERGETLGIVGESGCGKSSIAYTLMNILPSNAQILGGEILLQGQDLLKLKDQELRRVRWKEIALVPQASQNALTPPHKIEDQVVEAILVHEGLGRGFVLNPWEAKKQFRQHLEARGMARKKARERLAIVGIDPEKGRRYPHQLSGGENQRALIAMATVLDPKVIIADEPTTALDLIVQAHMLKFLNLLKSALGVSLILISHDISIISEMADKIAVMREGRIVEYGKAADVLLRPGHSYTKLLISSVPSIKGDVKKFEAIPAEEAVRAEGLKVEYRQKPLFGKPRVTVAVDRISFDIKKGEIFSLVGESGCGKTTTGKAILLDRKIAPIKEGRVFFCGRDITGITGKAESSYRKRAKMIFQNPYAALHGRMRVNDLLEEPLIIHGFKDKKARSEMVIKALEDVKLVPVEEFLAKYPHQLSGGQLQRICIARKLVCRPEFIVADEPVSMLDMSTRASILDLISELKEKHRITFLFITHDLAVARYLGGRIAVMYCGKIVETGQVKEVIDNPRHPYTKALVAAVLTPDPAVKIGDTLIKGEIFDFAVPQEGCRFAPRCYSASSKCFQSEPGCQIVSPHHLVSCHSYSKDGES